MVAHLAQTMRPLLDGPVGDLYTLRMPSVFLINGTFKGAVPAAFARGIAVQARSFLVTVLGPRQTAAHP